MYLGIRVTVMVSVSEIYLVITNTKLSLCVTFHLFRQEPQGAGLAINRSRFYLPHC